MHGALKSVTLRLRTMTRRLSLARAAIGVAVCTACSSTRPDDWIDPAAHRVTMIGVAPRVLLEVLDWGGTHPPMVFLAGLGDTGHAFDKFAARFQDVYRPIAITRRGFGASSHPDSGYDSAARSHEALSVTSATSRPLM